MYSSPDTSGRLSPPPPPMSANQSPMPGENSPEADEEYILMKVIVYDRGSQSINLKISRKNITRDVTKSVSTKLKINRDEGKLHNLVMAVTTTDLKHCIRTLKPDEIILDVFDSIIKTMSEKYQIADVTKLRSSVRWFYKDTRTPPLDLGDSGITVGEYDSDDEENLSESDCFYFSKVEKKGYVLKRSNKDTNVWKRWYCVLADHLWCIDFNREPYKVICIRLHSLVRVRDGHSFSDQIQSIIVNSMKGSHYFRAFNIIDQRSWVEHLQAWTSYVTDNESITMAEVIMNDEEDSKSRRFRKQMGRILDADTVNEAVRIDRRRPIVPVTSTGKNSRSKRPVVSIDDDLSSIEQYFAQQEQLSIANEATNENEKQVKVVSAIDKEREETVVLSDYDTRESFSDVTHSIPAATNNDSPSPSQPPRLQLALVENHDQNNSNDNNHSDQENGDFDISNDISPIPDSSDLTFPLSTYAKLNPLDRTLTQSTMHRLHQHEFLLSYLMGFVLDVLRYKELFRHDLFCSVQSQRDAAFGIFTKYFHKQARRAGIALHHDKLREIADEQAEIASTRLKETMSTQFAYTSRPAQRNRDVYIASPGSLLSTHNNNSSSSNNNTNVGSYGQTDYPTATVVSPNNQSQQQQQSTGSYNSAAMRSPSSNVQRQRDQSLLVQRLRTVSSSKFDENSAGLSTPIKALINDNMHQNTGNLYRPSLGFKNHYEEITEDNWQLSSVRFEKIIQALFGQLIRVQMESEEDDVDGIDQNPEHVSFSPTRTSTMISAHDIKSMASSRKANSPNPSGRASPLRGGAAYNNQTSSTNTNNAGGGFTFFGLFGGTSNSNNANTSSANNISSSSGSGKGNTLHQSLPARAAAVGGGGGLFTSRRFAANNSRANNHNAASGKAGAPNSAILQALEEEERAMVMSQIVATTEVFDEVVEDIIALLHQ